MTTRKALIERIQSMQLGTQEMLDAAKDDATLIPFDTLFVTSGSGMAVVYRSTCPADKKSEVVMRHVASGAWDFYAASNLLPITEE